MKKNILSYLITGFILGSILISCTNLDEDVYDKLPAGDFGKTEAELNALIGSTYNTLRTYWPDTYMYMSECGGSMAVTPTRKGGDWYDGGQYREFYMHTWTSQTSQVKSAWRKATEAIGACNANYVTVENSTLLTENVKTMRLAELRGIRAFWFYVMLDYWGNIPLVTDYTNKEPFVLTSRQEAFDWIIKEVAEIADVCPDVSAETYGKFTKGAAYTLLAKLYLNAEAWGVTVEGGYSAAYKKVIEHCDIVMGFTHYRLEPNWKDNFSPTNNNSREAILASAFSKLDTENRNILMQMTLHYKDRLAIGGSYSPWNGICAQPDYVKLFDTEDPRYKETFLIGQMYDLNTGEKIVTDHGFDLNHTVDVTIIPGTERDGTKWGDVNQHDGARCKKWPYESDLVDAMENDFHIFRLADVYLMKAEAALRSTNDVATATKLVNEIRARAYGDTNHNLTTVDLKAVALERKFELAWESWSRQDDIRFGTFEEGMWYSSNCERLKDDYLKLYPISFDAYKTNPNLKQNPGYPAF